MKKIIAFFTLLLLFSYSSLFAEHTHSWIFSAKENVFKAYCNEIAFSSDCDFQGLDNAVSLTVGTFNETKIKVNTVPSKDEDVFFFWESSDPDVISVNQDGTITAKGVGTAEITATTTDGSNVSATWEFSVSQKLHGNVSFDSNQPLKLTSATSMPSSKFVKIGQKITKPSEPSLTGCSFVGWYKESSCTNEWDFNTETVTTDITLYAKWTVNEYNVTLNPGDSLSKAFTVLTSYTYGTGLTLPADGEKTGYTFGGWYTNSDCTGDAVTSVSTTDIGNKEFWAKWTANTYSVVYNGNGNTGGSTASSSHTYTESKLLTTNGFTRSGYVFLGWNTNQYGTGTSYSDAQSVINLTTTQSATVNLYAQWGYITAYQISKNTAGYTYKATIVDSPTASSDFAYSVTKSDAESGIGTTIPVFGEAGGYVFYITDETNRYVEVALEDLYYTDKDDTKIYKMNYKNASSILCYKFIQGKSDWYIPTGGQMKLLFSKFESSFSYDYYWTSTESSKTYACLRLRDYLNSTHYGMPGSDNEVYHVRPVRSF